MPSSVIMPKTGMAMEEGTIVRWMKKPGDPVRTGEPIAEIETDKSTMELEAEADGVILAILHRDGETVPVSKVIAWIGKPGEAIPATAASPGASPGAAPPTGTAPTAAAPAAAKAGIPAAAAPPAAGGKVAATPAARRAAGERNVELSSVTPTGRHGEVREADVLRRAAAPLPAAPALVLADGDRRVALSSIQKVTGRRMLQSHLEIPPVTCQARADVTDMLAMRERINAGSEAKVTVNDMVMRATARALAAHPRVNSVLDGQDVVYRKAIDIGFAVATPEGLLVPVVRGADALSLAALAARTRELAARAKEKKLPAADMEGGSFTVSNMGMYGITAFTPIINQPQAAILGVCAIEEELHLVAGSVAARRVMGLSLTFDHRVLDGAAAALFLKEVKDSLENPLMILV